jgi:hypothetical protein
LPNSQKFRGIVVDILVVIVNVCNFWNIRFSCRVKDLSPGTPDFFYSSANALWSRRSRWRDDVRKERQCCFQMYKHFRRKYWVNLWESTQYINLCYASRAFNQVPILCRRYIHYTLQSYEGATVYVVFKCINISDVNIEILGIHVIHLYGHSIKFRYYLDGIFIYSDCIRCYCCYTRYTEKS